jgi:hypothetical protein
MRAPFRVLVPAVLLACGLAAGVSRASDADPTAPAPSGTEQFMAAAWEPGPMISPLALEGATLSTFGEEDSLKKSRKKAKKDQSASEPETEGMGLGPERARIILQSLTMPGWGQATLGRRNAAGVFATFEVAIWASFASFRIQEGMRKEAFRQTALLGAGIDLRGRDEEFKRIVGAFSSSDEYNLYVVSRDAANLYLKDVYNPNMDAYRAYIEENSLRGADSWSWSSRTAFERYGAQRKDAHRAAIRANSALGLAIANRLLSALHAARAAGQTKPAGHAWRLEVTPAPGDDATAFRAALSASF